MIILQVVQVTVPASANEVGIAVPNGMTLLGIETPSVLEPTSFTFKGSANNQAGPGKDIFKGHTLYRIPCAPDRFVTINNPEVFSGLKYLSVVCNLGGVASNVAAPRILNLSFGTLS